MSTCATYEIYDDYNDLDVCFYVHYDNYPEGAALYFQRMLDYRGMKEKEHLKLSYAEAFFRANSEAHFTKGHSWHEDTEYQYNIIKTEDNGYILEGRELCPDTMTSEKFFEGSVEDFIKLYKEDLQITEKSMIDSPIESIL